MGFVEAPHYVMCVCVCIHLDNQVSYYVPVPGLGCVQLYFDWVGGELEGEKKKKNMQPASSWISHD